jgi:hypothetical protein
MATQARFALQNVQGDLQQSLPQLFTHEAAMVIPRQRRQKSANVFTLLPTTFSFLADQMWSKLSKMRTRDI